MEKRKNKKVFDALLKCKSSRDGVGILDCRGKEAMIVTRYGGDIILSFFDMDSDEPKFISVFEMGKNSPKQWHKIFLRFVEIKNLLRQKK